MNQKSEIQSKREKLDKRNDEVRWSQYGPSGFQGFLDQLARRLEINVETFLVGVISLLLISIALLLDQLPLYLLAILISPIVAPILGFAFGFTLGSIKFLRIGFLSLLLNFMSFFIVGAFSGFIARQFPGSDFSLWQYFVNFTWSGLLLLFIGILIMVSTIIRNPRQASLVANVALAYSFYLPIVSSGFAYGLGRNDQFVSGLYTFLFYFIFAIVIGVLVLFAYRIRPRTVKNSLGVVSLLFLLIIGTFFFYKPDLEPLNFITNNNEIQSNLLKLTTSTLVSQEVKSTPISTATQTEAVLSIFDQKPTEIITMIPTSTATITLTPLPTIVWAEIQSPEGNGANIREEPGYSSKLIRTVLNGTPVQVLDDVAVVDGATWVNIRLVDLVEGWIVRSLLVSATPEPEW